MAQIAVYRESGGGKGHNLMPRNQAKPVGSLSNLPVAERTKACF